MSDPNIRQIIAGMPSRFDPNAVPDLSAVLQFRLRGDEALDFYAIIDKGECMTVEGMHDQPTMTMKMTTTTYLDMVMGRVTGQEAFFKRKLQYNGPISLAVKLHRLFRPFQAQ